MRRFILTSICLVVLATAGMVGQTQLPWSVVGSGGGIGAVSGGRLLSGTIGQPIIGIVAKTDGSRLSQGFWLPLNDSLVGVDEDGGGNQSLANDVTNYPNPFSSSTTIRFVAPVEGPVQVRVFDVNGQLVRTISAELSLAGGQEVLFDGLTDTGAPLGSGAYLYEVTGTGPDGRQFRRVQRMTIIR